MPGRKKKFIDKKNAVTFHLVHRSQRDPLQADEDAPERVLVPVEQINEQDVTEARKAEQRKFGVFFDDDYDYLQHLRDVNEIREVGPTETYRVESKKGKKSQDKVEILDPAEPNIKLPSSVFGSEIETEVGMLNKAAPDRDPKFDWDPDIVAALDDDFDFEDPDNELEDDFLALANAGHEETNQTEPPGSFQNNTAFDKIPEEREDSYDTDEYEDEGEEFGSDGNFSDNVSDVGSLGQHSFMQMETQSRFTDYSMTSSVIQRNKGLTLLDDQFEKLYEQYDDAEIGALDHEDIDGSLQQGSVLINSIMDDFKKEQELIRMKDAVFVKKAENVSLVSESESSDEEIERMDIVAEAPKEQWDCESILSTYSTLYNHPKLIEEPKKVKPGQVRKRNAVPEGSLATRGLTEKEINEEMNMTNSTKAPTVRPKGESKEERRTRKAAIKEERRGRREEKNANKMAFKAEKLRRDKEVKNVQQNLQGLKIL